MKPTASNIKQVLKNFFDNEISKEDTVVLMNGVNNKTFIKFVEHYKAKILLERMSQVWEDKEFVFAIKVLWDLQKDLHNIFPAVKKFKSDKKEEEDKDKKE